MRRPTANAGSQYVLLTFVLFLALFGVVLVYSSSASVALIKNRDTIAFARRQLISFGIGILLLLIGWTVDYVKLMKISKVLMLGTFVMLVVVLFVPTANHVNRSFRVFGFSVIPSEFAKLTVVLYLAAAFSRKSDRMDSFWRGPFFQLVVLGTACLLVFIQPSHTNAIFLGLIGFTVWFYAGASKKHLIPLSVAFIGISIFFITSHEYAQLRVEKYIQTVLNPLSSANYHTSQATMSIINGGLFGVGLGNSEHSLHYLPEAHTDFLWAILCEELGLLRASALLGMYFIIIFIGFKIALGCRDLSGRLAAAGIITCFALQTVMHLLVVTTLMPTTGVALPLMSYGGSSLITILAGMGILMNVARYTGHFELEA